jgi:iron(III) transport system permease protein
MGGLLSAKRATLVAAALVFAAVGLLPLCLMIGSSLWVDGGFSVRNHVEVLGNARTWVLFRNSLLLATLTTAIAGLAGVTLGILVAKTDLPFGSSLSVVFCLPLLFPPYILAVGWFEILGRGGILTRWIGPTAGEKTSRWLFGLPGAVLVLASAFLPIILLLTITYLRGMNPSLEEAGRLSSGWPSVIRRITLPLIMPGILLSLVLVFLLSMGEFGAPAFLRLSVFPVASFTQSSAFYNFGAATAAAMPVIAVVLVGLLAVERVLHKKTYSFRWGGQPAFDRIPLGRKRPFALMAVIALAAILVGMPLGGVLWHGASITALSDAVQRAGGSAIRSVLYAGISASLLCVLGFFLAYLVDRRALAGWWSLDALTLFLFTLPGTVIAIGLIALWNHPSTNWIYATPAMLIIGFVAQYAALSVRIVMAGYSQISPSLEEAAEVAGVGWFRRVFGILAPVARPVLVTAWAVTFVFCLRDVALPLLLAPPGRDTLTARTMTLMANGSPELIAALCLLAVLLALVPLSALAVVWRAWTKPV